MSNREQIGGPAGGTRPFASGHEQSDPQHDIAEALDRIAGAITEINRNLEALIARIDADSLAVARLAASLEGGSS